MKKIDEKNTYGQIICFMFYIYLTKHFKIYFDVKSCEQIYTHLDYGKMRL